MENRYTLTPTQITFLQLIAAGHSALTAGEIMSGKANTGRTHADNIRLRMNVQDIGAAVILAHQLGHINLNKIKVNLKDPTNPPAIYQ